MREYGQVQCSYWRHPEIRALQGSAREFGLYLLTGPHSNGIGCYFLPDGYVIEDLNWSKETVREAFKELSAIGFVKRCELTCFVLLPDFLKWNEIANPNVARARMKEVESVPKKSQIYKQLCESLQRFGKHWPDDFKEVLATSSKQEPTRTNPIPEPEKTQTRARSVVVSESKNGFHLPDWIPVEAWNGFVAMRVKIKKPMTDRAKEMAVAKLDVLRAAGENVEEVLKQSEFFDWQGLYAVKPEYKSKAVGGRVPEPDFGKGVSADGRF